jgi:hypothetical protein
MQATFSYTSILHAVGQVLDQIDVKSIAIHEEEDGLFVEGSPNLHTSTPDPDKDDTRDGADDTPGGSYDQPYCGL